MKLSDMVQDVLSALELTEEQVETRRRIQATRISGEVLIFGVGKRIENGNFTCLEEIEALAKSLKTAAKIMRETAFDYADLYQELAQSTVAKMAADHTPNIKQ